MDHLERLRSWPIENPAEWWEQQDSFWSRDRRGYHHSQKRRALAFDAFVEFIDKRLVYRLCEGLCVLCGDYVPISQATLDHLTPLSRGGAHSYANIALSHGYCNRAKGTMTLEEYRHSLKQAA